MTDRDMHNTSDIGTPEGNPSSNTPQMTPQLDHSFTLQAVMELQKCTGELTSTVNSLKDSLERQDAKLDKIEDKLSGISHKVYAAIVIATIILAISGWFVNKAWDMMASQITISAIEKTKTEPVPKKKP